jgi:hypothetical protein
VTIVLVIMLASCAALGFAFIARKRAEQRATQALLAKLKAAKKTRIPVVSNNVRGVTASQTIEPLRPARKARDDDEAGAG